MKIAIGCDHAGYDLKERLKKNLEGKGINFQDFGAFSSDSVDYPDFAHAVAAEISSGNFDAGVLICGSGNGISMTANKYNWVRAALCWTPEIAELARLHNDANILSLPARFITQEQGVEILEKFIETSFEGGRHERRVNKINCP